MKKILLMFTALFCLNAMALSTHKPVDCFGTPEVMKMVREDFKEVVIFESINAITGKSKIALFINANTGTWTLVEYDTDNACILGAGQSSST